MDSFWYSPKKSWVLLYFETSESSLHSGFCTWSYRPIEPLECTGPNQFVSSGKPFSVLRTPYQMLHHGELVTRVALLAAMVCSDSLGCALVWTVQHVPVPIGKGGRASYSAPANWFSFKVGVFQNLGASSFCIRASLQKFLDVYPTIVWVLREVPTSMHQTATSLVLHFRICSEIHPPLTIHHMSIAPLPLFLCNTMT